MSDKTQLTLLVKKFLGESEYQNLVGSISSSSSEQEFSSVHNKYPEYSTKMKTYLPTKLQMECDEQTKCNYTQRRSDLIDGYANYKTQLLNTHLNQLLPFEYDSSEELNGPSNLQFLDNFQSSSPKFKKETTELPINFNTQNYLEQVRENIDQFSLLKKFSQNEKPNFDLKNENKNKKKSQIQSQSHHYGCSSNIKNNTFRITNTINNFLRKQHQLQLQQQSLYQQNLKTIEKWKQIERELKNYNQTKIIKQQIIRNNENMIYQNNKNQYVFNNKNNTTFNTHQASSNNGNNNNSNNNNSDNDHNNDNNISNNNNNNNKNPKPNSNIIYQNEELEEVDLESKKARKVIESFLVSPLNLKETTNRENPSTGVILYLHLRNVIKTSQKSGTNASKYIIMDKADESLIRRGKCSEEMAKFISNRLFFNPEFSKSGRKRGRKPRKQPQIISKRKCKTTNKNKKNNQNKIRKKNNSSLLIAKSSTITATTTTTTTTPKTTFNGGNGIYTNLCKEQKVQNNISAFGNYHNFN
ncbi:morphogenesis protein sog2 [Anaeramoeba flamelloides]|uniref:Morphogenesis protein sog2 n=1 Tax=Anaeramoeba flamelloides TaxID=1746091 RepID=A0AAV8ADQ5_9EUKA|nr:morphogenesis protein sog2 [Anaeramoeba flamelloides]